MTILVSLGHTIAIIRANKFGKSHKQDGKITKYHVTTCSGVVIKTLISNAVIFNCSQSFQYYANEISRIVHTFLNIKWREVLVKVHAIIDEVHTLFW